MISVVHIITKLELGGAQENTLDTVAGLDRDRFRVTLMYGPGGELDERLPALQDTTRMLPVPELVRELAPNPDARCVTALRRLL